MVEEGPLAEGLRVVTYNVHGFVGRDGAHDPGRTVRVLEELDAEIAALQEVVSPTRPDDGALAGLAERLGAELVQGPTLERDRGSYGNVLLTRLPVRCVRHLDLSVAGREPRGAIDCVLEAGSTPLRVVATHLGRHGWERRLQAHRLAEELARPGPSIVLLLGDLNEWRIRWGSLAPLRGLLGPALGPRSFPAWRPTLRLDRIWARPGGLLRRVGAHRSHLAREASDHLPVRGELQLGVRRRGGHCRSCPPGPSSAGRGTVPAGACWHGPCTPEARDAPTAPDEPRRHESE